MEDIIRVFLGNGSGYGHGHGYVYGHVDGYGYGLGFGNWHGHVDGYGYGLGNGSGSGNGSGNGNGSGSEYSILGKKIYKIDNVNTILLAIKGNIARGYIVKDDLTFLKTYITKSDSYFAHGNTIKESLMALEEKIIQDLDAEEIIEIFLKEIDVTKKYKGQYFFDWHGKLTGSCKQGREAFVKNKNIDLSAEINVNEFITICENDYGRPIIMILKDRLKGCVSDESQIQRTASQMEENTIGRTRIN